LNPNYHRLDTETIELPSLACHFVRSGIPHSLLHPNHSLTSSIHRTQEQEQLSALRQQHLNTPERTASHPTEPAASKVTDVSKEMRSRVDEIEKKSVSRAAEIEGGFGGQEELEDRYATTSGEH
jgi:hypothetical protein